VHRECSTDDCGAKVAKAASARFVVFSKVSAADEIYTVTLLLYDDGLGSRVKKVVKECELCAAKEVNGTLGEAVAALKKTMLTPAPVAKKPAPEPMSGVKVTIRSTPPGATVSIGGVQKGKTPVTFSVKPGSYDLTVKKEGYKSASRKLPVLDRPVKLRMTLKPDPKAAVAKAIPKITPAVVVPPPKAAPDLAKPTPLPPESVGTAYNGAALGMIVGGLALSGLGTYLVVLDGEITCPDGTRRDCPTVYNTKGFGLTSFGAGAALVGAGAALIIEDAVRMSREKAKLSVGASPTSGGAFFSVSGGF